MKRFFDFFSHNNFVRPVYVNVWKKPNGEFYVKLTKRPVIKNSVNLYFENQYGHKLVDSIKQYININF